MSELVLKVKPGSGYDDGDILCAVNRRAIRCVHAQHLCFQRGPDRRLSRLTAGGLLRSTDVAKDFMEATHEFRFERMGRFTLTITRLSDSRTIDIQSNKTFIGFNGRPQHMDIEVFVARRRASLSAPGAQGVPMFGTDGREVWYGGRQDYSAAKLDTVWTAIQSKLGRTDSEFPLWPAGRRELRSHLFLPTTDFDDAEAEALVEQDIDDTDPENPVVIKKRKRQLVWRDLDIGRTVRDIEDRRKSIDVRQSVSPVDRRIVEIKADGRFD